MRDPARIGQLIPHTQRLQAVYDFKKNGDQLVYSLFKLQPFLRVSQGYLCGSFMICDKRKKFHNLLGL